MVSQKEAKEYRDFYRLVLLYLEKTKQAWCFTKYGIVSREEASEYLTKTGSI